MNDSRRERLYQTEAIVIGRLDLGEADRIFTVVTPGRGKYRVIAKGVRRPQSRMAAHLGYFARCGLMLARGRDLDVVTGAQTLETFDLLQGDLVAFGHASYLGELVNRMTEDGEEHRAVYDLLISSLRLLGGSVDSFLVVRHFELALLALLGYRPELYRCVGCGNEIEATANGLSPALGGMVCAACRGGDQPTITLSVNAQKLLRVLDRSGLSRAAALDVDPRTAAEVEQALTAIIRQHASRELTSPRVIREIREGLPAHLPSAVLPSV